MFGSHCHLIIKTRKVDPRAEGGARILIKESDRDVLSLEKSLTDTTFDKDGVRENVVGCHWSK
jgi:hypothetical protein